jgi:hypothetical protein
VNVLTFIMYPLGKWTILFSFHFVKCNNVSDNQYSAMIWEKLANLKIAKHRPIRFILQVALLHIFSDSPSRYWFVAHAIRPNHF